MKLQQQYEVTDSDNDATQSEVVNPGGPGNSGGPAVNWDQIKNDMSNQTTTGPQYGKEDYEAAAQNSKLDSNINDPGEVEQNTDGNLGQKGTNIRGFVFQSLEQLGAPARLIMDNPDTFFQGKKDLDTGTITGTYVLPSYTKNKKITQEEAEGIAAKIGERFGLSQSISPQGNNFKIDFRTREMMTPEDHGTSLQELVKNKGGGSSGQPGGSSGGSGRGKAAHTQTEMIKESRNALYEAILKLGLGE
jgi:hypothetical protein